MRHTTLTKEQLDSLRRLSVAVTAIGCVASNPKAVLGMMIFLSFFLWMLGGSLVRLGDKLERLLRRRSTTMIALNTLFGYLGYRVSPRRRRHRRRRDGLFL